MTKEALRTISLILAGLTPSLSIACDTPEPSLKATKWHVTETDWTPLGEREYWNLASNEAFPGWEVPLPMYGSSWAHVLDWSLPFEYEGKIGLLTYYAGGAGTQSTIDWINVLILDLHAREILGVGNRLTIENGECSLTSWTWDNDQLIIDDPVIGTQEVELPLLN